MWLLFTLKNNKKSKKPPFLRSYIVNNTIVWQKQIERTRGRHVHKSGRNKNKVGCMKANFVCQRQTIVYWKQMEKEKRAELFEIIN